MHRNTLSEVVLILAPFGRDAQLASTLLAESGLRSDICHDLGALGEGLSQGAGAALVTEEAVMNDNTGVLSHWLRIQPSWSDLPFILIPNRDSGIERNVVAQRIMEMVGNVTVLERPFHPSTLITMVRAALRSRRRQYETRAHLAAIRDAAERLDDEKNRLQAVLSNVPVGILFAEKSGKIVAGNPQLERILRHPVLPADNVEGHGEWVSYHADGRQVEGKEYPLPRAMQSGEAVGPEDFLYQRGDGTKAWIQLAAAPIRDREGNVIAGVVSAVDIDRQKTTEEELRHSEAALRDSESRFRAMADSIDPMVWSCNAAGQHDYYNQRWYDFTGLTENSHSTDDTAPLIHPEDKQGLSPLWRKCRETGEPYVAEYRLRHRSGNYRWVLVRALPARNERGEIVRWFGTCTDIQDLVDARDVLARSREELEVQVRERTVRLAASEARFRILFEHSPFLAMLIRVGPGEQIVYEAVNSATEKFLGRSAGEIVGHDLSEIFGDGEREELSRRYRDAAISGKVVRYELKLHIAGSDKIAESILVPVMEETDHDGSHLVLVSARELTAQRAIEDQLRQSQKMEAVGQLTGGIAHDFNNLLAGISGSLELVAIRIGQGRGDETGKYLSAARSSVDRAAALTHRLLAFSRRQTLDPKPTVANTLITSMEDLLRRTAGPMIQFDTSLASDLWTGFCDANQLENALLNLAINARDAMPDGGRLFIETENVELDEAYAGTQQDVKPSPYVSISVTDTGTGMPPEVIARAFDPFFTTKPLGQGTGLGLSMVFGFVKQSGGHVRIYSEVGNGTTVAIYLPRFFGEGAPAQDNHEAGSQDNRAEGETVLIVDDEPTIRMLVTEALEDLGYKILEAGDGAAAISLIETGVNLDLLITDVGLPGGMNGRQLADRVRQIRPGLKVLFITGYAANAAVGNGVIETGMEVMTKPFAMESLAAKVRGMIEDGN